MEDMARLALVEQTVKDNEKYTRILYELLGHINLMLENPHDFDLRVIKRSTLKEVIHNKSFMDYLKYIGFKPVNSDFIYLNTSPISNLRIAQAAIQRKIAFCTGSLNNRKMSVKCTESLFKIKRLPPLANVLNTKNKFLLKIQELFNTMLEYEDEELLAQARECIPLVTLQMMALDRVREHQMKIKTGGTKTYDLPYDLALLMELLGWFKHKFFTWVDKPECDLCGGQTIFTETVLKTVRDETCRVELYKCTECRDGLSRFPRHNRAGTLLVTRRGRCGEWAHCFTLLCRSLGYDTRYVYDVTDHVWCEVFDFDSRAWMHIDPCEGKLNAPLLYSEGWGKQLTYVMAFSRDDLQDVTWRYTVNHKEVLTRRKQCSEFELTRAILALRDQRQRYVSDARRLYLKRRAVQELVQLMFERRPSDFECHGRISGSAKWRMDRGEMGAQSHTFYLTKPGSHLMQYGAAGDKYCNSCDGLVTQEMMYWRSGVYEAKHIFRKVETDWKQVYLAREEGEPSGMISWRFCSGEGLQGSSLEAKFYVAEYGSGQVAWSIQFDNEAPIALPKVPHFNFVRKFKQVIIKAELSGGDGDVAWQQAQLFRQPLNINSGAFEVATTVVAMDN